MKKTLLIIGLLFTLNSYSQKKDSLTYLPDSVNTISISDMDKVLQSMVDKLSKREWDTWLAAYQQLIIATNEKRKVKPKK